MALDIRNSDTLIVGNKRYPIARAASYQTSAMNTVGFRRSLVNACSIVRTIKGSDTTIFTGYCSYLDPVDPETRKRLALETPHTVKQTFIADGDGFLQLFFEDLER